MGPEASQEKAKKIPNTTARTIFLNFAECAQAQPNEIKTSKGFKKMVLAFHHSCEIQPEGQFYLPIQISGKNLGPPFVRIGLNFLKSYPQIAVISLRNSSLKNEDAIALSRFIRTASSLREIDLSENQFNQDGVTEVIRAATGHPRLEALILESVGTKPEIVSVLCPLLSAKTTHLKSLRISPLTFNPAQLKQLGAALKSNVRLTSLQYAPDPQSDHLGEIDHILKRNNEVEIIIKEIISAPFHREFKKRNELFKSVKGRRMAEGRAQQLEALKGTQMFDLFTNSQAKASSATPSDYGQTTGVLKYGISETIGRRESMEDYCSVNAQEGALFVGLYDGHGGREASEYAGQNLPKAMSRFTDLPLPEEFTKALAFLHDEMKSWASYCGTTVAAGLISETHITVANLGDTRVYRVTPTDIIPLSVDHKPDLPEEKARIEKVGSRVENGRINGQLAVSRALGDSSFGDAVSAVPSIHDSPLETGDAVIFACDGVWDVMHEQKCAEIVRGEIDPILAARKIRDAAFDAGSTDNISVIVIFVTGKIRSK